MCNTWEDIKIEEFPYKNTRSNPKGCFSKKVFFIATFCIYVKRMMLCNCRCSPSSHDFASLIQNIKKFGAKNCLTDHQRANTIRNFRDSVLEIMWLLLGYANTWLLLGYTKIWATFHSYPSDARQEQCVNVYNPLQTVFKHFKLYILAQIVWEISYIADKCFSHYL